MYHVSITCDLQFWQNKSSVESQNIYFISKSNGKNFETITIPGLVTNGDDTGRILIQARPLITTQQKLKIFVQESESSPAGTDLFTSLAHDSLVSVITFSA